MLIQKLVKFYRAIVTGNTCKIACAHYMWQSHAILLINLQTTDSMLIDYSLSNRKMSEWILRPDCFLGDFWDISYLLILLFP